MLWTEDGAAPRSCNIHQADRGSILPLVAEWIHFTLFGIILSNIKPKVYTFGGLKNSAAKFLACRDLRRVPTVQGLGF